MKNFCAENRDCCRPTLGWKTSLNLVTQNRSFVPRLENLPPDLPFWRKALILLRVLCLDTTKEGKNS